MQSPTNIKGTRHSCVYLSCIWALLSFSSSKIWVNQKWLFRLKGFPFSGRCLLVETHPEMEATRSCERLVSTTPQESQHRNHDLNPHRSKNLKSLKFLVLVTFLHIHSIRIKMCYFSYKTYTNKPQSGIKLTVLKRTRVLPDLNFDQRSCISMIFVASSHSLQANGWYIS